MNIDAMHRIISETPPKDIWAKYKVLRVYDGRVDVDATIEIFNETYDKGTKRFSFHMGVNYPNHSPHEFIIKRAIAVTKNGKDTTIDPPDYMLTQNDFDAAIIRGEKITVPTLP